MRLSFPDNAVVAVAGVPGAGKSTLIRRAVDRSVAAVVDTDDQRRDGGRASHVRHYAHILAAVRGSRPVVIHSRGTVGTLRRAIALGLGPARQACHLKCAAGARGEGRASVTVPDRPSAAAAEPLQWTATYTPGTTGFDVVGSWGWLRVEVPEASLNPGNNTSAKSHDFSLA